MSLVVIPARGGSKGIPGKNIAALAGKPLIVWTIRQALAARLVGQVWVTTDCAAIAQVAEDAGAIVHWRSAETATDTATTESAIHELLLSLSPSERDHVTVLLQATSPIRQPGDIDGAIGAMVAHSADSVFSARIVEGYTWTATPEFAHPHYQERLPRQQIMARTLEENGSIYVFRTDGFLKKQNRLFGKVVPYVMHPLDSFQVDEPADLMLMEQLMPIRMPSCQ